MGNFMSSGSVPPVQRGMKVTQRGPAGGLGVR